MFQLNNSEIFMFDDKTIQNTFSIPENNCIQPTHQEGELDSNEEILYNAVLEMLTTSQDSLTFTRRDIKNMIINQWPDSWKYRLDHIVRLCSEDFLDGMVQPPPTLTPPPKQIIKRKTVKKPIKRTEQQPRNSRVLTREQRALRRRRQSA